jgi:hypothetical protein
MGVRLRFSTRLRRESLSVVRGWAAAALIVAAAPVAVPGSAQSPAADAIARAIEAPALRAHLEFLASDALEGRGTGTRGGDLAAKYVAAQFERMGLLPAGDNGTYFQTIPLQGRSFTSSLSPASGLPLEPGTDFVAYHTGSADSALAVGDVVFAGYGITAPEESWDDYAGTDVSGKVVLALAGTPANQSGALFRHAKTPEYGLREYKIRQALERGAVAAFVVYRAPYPVAWSEIAGAWSGEQFQLSGSKKGPAIVAGWLNTPAAGRLLSQAGESLEQLVRAAAQPGFRARPLGLRLKATVRARLRDVPAVNVLGLLPARAGRAAEAVLLGAHYDHLGVGAPINGDSIYNGAIDNASGTAGMLAIAEAAISSGLTPTRSVIFAAFGAEEIGLLGSETFVRRPRIPLDRLVAMLNLDGVNLIAETRDIAALGTEWSTLSAPFAAAAAAEGYASTPRDSPILRVAVEQDFFDRSDQASFARAGVPSLFLYFGDQIAGAAPGSGKQRLDDYLQHHYHRPNDDLGQPFDYRAGARSLRVLARTLVAVANAPEAPRWTPGAPYRR